LALEKKGDLENILEIVAERQTGNYNFIVILDLIGAGGHLFAISVKK